MEYIIGCRYKDKQGLVHSSTSYCPECKDVPLEERISYMDKKDEEITMALYPNGWGNLDEILTKEEKKYCEKRRKQEWKKKD